mmetsp:Transcript_14608/g.36366  ORF Transcript_14608/g.36366 Transcript_14608/m.36366 type:complete len:123 (-) Transcript_14608:254-622(-)
MRFLAHYPSRTVATPAKGCKMYSSRMSRTMPLALLIISTGRWLWVSPAQGAGSEHLTATTTASSNNSSMMGTWEQLVRESIRESAVAAAQARANCSQSMGWLQEYAAMHQGMLRQPGTARWV